MCINWLFTKITPSSYTTSRESYLGITRHRPARALLGTRRLRAAPVRPARPLAEAAELRLDFRRRVEHGPRVRLHDAHGYGSRVVAHVGQRAVAFVGRAVQLNSPKKSGENPTRVSETSAFREQRLQAVRRRKT